MRKAKPVVLIWVAIVALAALVASLYAEWITEATPTAWVLLAVLTISAASANVFPIRTAADGATYRLNNVFILAGALLLPLNLLTPLVALALAPDLWLRRKRPRLLIEWTFNWGQTALSTLLAGMWVQLITDGQLGWAGDLISVIGAAVVFTLAQAFFVGTIIAVDRKVPLFRSPTFTLPALLSDGMGSVFGIVVAELWVAKPQLLVLVPVMLFIAHRMTRTAHLAHLAEMDAKTGLHNSRYFEQALEEELAHSLRVKRPLSLLFFDLDHFKRVNDVHGHAAGDDVLRGLASLLRENTRKGDLVARFGGEEFVMLLPGTEVKEALYLAERIRDAVEQHLFDLPDGQTIHCTVSIGVANCPTDAETLTGLINEADGAMYRAKRTRNAVALARTAPVVPRLLTLDEDSPLAAPAPLPAMPASSSAAVTSQAHETVGTNGTNGATVSVNGSARLTSAEVPAANGVTLPTSPVDEPVPTRRKTDDAFPPPKPSPFAPYMLWSSIGVGSAVLLVSAFLMTRDDGWLELLPFLAVAVLAELLKVEVYEGGEHKVSLSFAIAVNMGAVVAHPFGAPVVALVAALVHVGMGRQRQIGKLLFNLTNTPLATACAVMVYQAMSHIQVDVTGWTLAIGLVAVLAYYIVNVGLISLIISLHSGRSLPLVVRESAWFAPTNLLIGVTGAFLGGAHQQLGPVGMVMFVVPILVMRFTLTFYASRTQRYIESLKAAKAEVEGAHNEKEEMLRKLIETVALIIDARDNSVSGHSRRVAKFAVALGKELGLSTSDLAVIHTAGLFHDLGKVGIPEAILHKPSRLTDEEYKVIKEHARLGQRILSEVPQLADISRMVGEHHERYDGSGYPRGLASRDISLGGRILVVSDSLETMLADRPYSKGRPLSAALAELDRCAGTHFDPVIVEAVHMAVAHLGEEFFVGKLGPVGQNWEAADHILAQVFA